MKWSLALACAALLAGCDQSKEELEKTKTELASTVKERDSLKAQVGDLQKQLAAAKAEAAKPPAGAPPAGAPPAGAAPPAAPAPAKPAAPPPAPAPKK